VGNNDNTEQTIKNLIQNDMDNNILVQKVDGITRLSWVADDSNPIDNPIDVLNSPDEPSSITYTAINNDGKEIAIGILAGACVLFIGMYSVHKSQKRREENKSAQQSNESDENFVELP